MGGHVALQAACPDCACKWTAGFHHGKSTAGKVVVERERERMVDGVVEAQQLKAWHSDPGVHVIC